MFAEKLSNAAANGGAGVAVGSGVVKGAELVLGMTPSQWSVTGVIGGLVIGFAGLLLNAYFQWRRS